MFPFSAKATPVWVPQPSEYQVAFYAGLSRSIETRPTPKECPLIFDTVLLNLGSGYNSSTGHFTAPASGVYVFVLVVSAQSYEKVSPSHSFSWTNKMDIHTHYKRGKPRFRGKGKYLLSLIMKFLALRLFSRLVLTVRNIGKKNFYQLDNLLQSMINCW